MKWFRRGLRLVLCITTICTLFMAFNCTRSQNNSGGYSSVTAITVEDREWILDRFGNCSDVECLLRCIENYAVQNLKYDYNKMAIFQHFDFRDLVNSKEGICFDFACFVKTVFLEVSKRNNWPVDKVFVVDIKHKHKSFLSFGHSYNVIQMQDGRSYYIDITNSIYEVQMERKQPPGFELFRESIKEYAAKYNERVICLH